MSKQEWAQLEKLCFGSVMAEYGSTRLHEPFHEVLD